MIQGLVIKSTLKKSLLTAVTEGECYNSEEDFAGHCQLE